MPRHTPILTAPEMDELVETQNQNPRLSLGRVILGGLSLMTLISLLFV